MTKKKSLHQDFMNVAQLQAYGKFLERRREKESRKDVIKKTCTQKNESGRKNKIK